MTPSRGRLSGFRASFLEPITALVCFSEILLADTGDLGQDQFVTDLTRLHASSRRLREMAIEFFELDDQRTEEEDAATLLTEKTLRHDMLNALNVIINLSEFWIEDCEEQFLVGFLEDLKRIYRHGKTCLEVLGRIRNWEPGSPEAPETPPPETPYEPGPAIPHHAVEPGCCLVVDDSELNRDSLTRLLVRQGHCVETAENGLEALEKIRTTSFDVVFLDIMMPVMNGLELLRRLKSDEHLRYLPVIMISALEQVDGVARCIETGAEDYLPKPFNPLLLRARLAACLDKKRFRDKETLYLRQIEQEKKRSEELLHVILPDAVVTELMATNEVKPRRIDGVAVLFADIVGFTPYCDQHGPEEVVPYLQKLVEAWENCALKHGVDKIKTIGDAFMAASGLLQETENPVLNCVRCGLEMIAATQALPVGWNLRVGIHLGSVVAGIIGTRQYLYDLWGDTVNTAARMESHSLHGRITLTGEAWGAVRDLAEADTEVIPVKGKGSQEVFRFRGFRQGT
jgi:class 3 adenylate cyclase/CheY-like chemotaxis protein